MADGIHGVLDAADVGVLRRQTRHQLGAKIGTRARREIVEDHGQLRHLGDTAKVNLSGKVGRAKIIRGDREHGVGAHFLSIAREIEDVGIRRIAHSSKDLHAAGNTVHSELQSLLLLVEAHAVKLADASKQQHAIHARIGKMVKMLAPQVEIDFSLIIRNSDRRAKNAFKHVCISLSRTGAIAQILT